ncbi:hypothetical protein IEO21_09356 [Rhodonia placenta]|uniref:Uncharacterized protein n=1 Tax=Rhodonia placenta TaxID=104341 RepID=A0A8H7TXU4_9APHY|nr:hypothetical protein IEO21_09356 [Postia placenta]
MRASIALSVVLVAASAAPAFAAPIQAAPQPEGSEAINWGKIANVAGKIAGVAGKVLSFLKREDPILARQFEDELMVRAAPPPADGSEAINWGKIAGVAGKVAGVAGKVLSFLKREDPMLARAFEDELVARAEREDELLAREFREDPLLARAFEDELYARAAPEGAEGSEAINWGKVAGVAGKVLSFLKRDDMVLDMLD